MMGRGRVDVAGRDAVVGRDESAMELVVGRDASDVELVVGRDTVLDVVGRDTPTGPLPRALDGNGANGVVTGMVACVVCSG